MAKKARKTANVARSAQTAKYDAHHEVMEETYGALADLRRQLADSPELIKRREKTLKEFSECPDTQRAWLLLEDYFECLSLARKDFDTTGNWWDSLVDESGSARLEALSMLFLRSNRSLPPELLDYADFDRFEELEAARATEEVADALEEWLFPDADTKRETARANLRVIASLEPSDVQPGLHRLGIAFRVFRPRTGERGRLISELVELTQRATQERELFSAEDWEFLTWLAHEYRDFDGFDEGLSGSALFHWLSRWGDRQRIELDGQETPLSFHGRVARLQPTIDGDGEDAALTTIVEGPGATTAVSDASFFSGKPSLTLVGSEFFLLTNAPEAGLLGRLRDQPLVPVNGLGIRLVARLYRRYRDRGSEWEALCVSHTARPIFVFEILEDTLQLKLTAVSERDESQWRWVGSEWALEEGERRGSDRHEILDDPRLEPAVAWLQRFDWFSQEPGVWQADISPFFLERVATEWPDRPKECEYLGDENFRRLFIDGKRLRPKLVVQGSGIDWFSVSAEWEREGAALSERDLKRLRNAMDRFVELPDAGWVELDTGGVMDAHETLAELGLEGVEKGARKVAFAQAASAPEEALNRLERAAGGKSVRQSLKDFKGYEPVPIPETVDATLRPYQKEGFHFLAHLFRSGIGGVLADDMGLGKTLQTLTALEWLGRSLGSKRKPSLVICPASVLHNWKREANRFVPTMRTLVLESGSKRHNLRERIPEYDLIVTNYSLLRRDLEELKKFEFLVVALDEAQFIKNPSAQVTRSVKQLRAQRRLALTGTPLENRLLDLWSIVDFTQPGYLGTQQEFLKRYESERDDPAKWQVSRRRLSAKLRAILLRRLKKQVAADLPERIEERRDCDLGVAQRKLYLAELRRSREQVRRAVSENGAAKSKMHVLAALTRLRQICCHPKLVGSDAGSGKTDALFEILEPLIDRGEKALLFSQFVEMLGLLESDLVERGIRTYRITGATKNRQEIVNAFQEDERPSVFLLSLRAAGTGLNLTSASYVALYDPWWNPAVEAQAIDRCHRIGQTKTVNAYRLITPGTVEEKIWELQQRKSKTITDILGEEGFTRSLTQEDLDYLFSED